MLVGIDDCRVRYRIVFGACHRAIRVSPQKLPSMLPLRSVSGLVIKGTAGPGLGIGPVGKITQLALQPFNLGLECGVPRFEVFAL